MTAETLNTHSEVDEVVGTKDGDNVFTQLWLLFKQKQAGIAYEINRPALEQKYSAQIKKIRVTALQLEAKGWRPSFITKFVTKFLKNHCPGIKVVATDLYGDVYLHDSEETNLVYRNSYHSLDGDDDDKI